MRAPRSDGETDDTQGRSRSDEPAAPTVPQAGVLGNLPKTRPSVRSPRRTDKAVETERARRAREPSEAEDTDDRGRRDADPDSGGSEIEALARGGIAIAGEAATLGLRIAGRAAAAVRDAVERR